MRADREIETMLMTHKFHADCPFTVLVAALVASDSCVQYVITEDTGENATGGFVVVMQSNDERDTERMIRIECFVRGYLAGHKA